MDGEGKPTLDTLAISDAELRELSTLINRLPHEPAAADEVKRRIIALPADDLSRKGLLTQIHHVYTDQASAEARAYARRAYGMMGFAKAFDERLFLAADRGEAQLHIMRRVSGKAQLQKTALCGADWINAWEWPPYGSWNIDGVPSCSSCQSLASKEVDLAEIGERPGDPLQPEWQETTAARALTRAVSALNEALESKGLDTNLYGGCAGAWTDAYLEELVAQLQSHDDKALIERLGKQGRPLKDLEACLPSGYYRIVDLIGSELLERAGKEWHVNKRYSTKTKAPGEKHPLVRALAGRVLEISQERRAEQQQKAVDRPVPALSAVELRALGQQYEAMQQISAPRLERQLEGSREPDLS